MENEQISQELENIIKRILYFKNPYDVLDVPPDTPLEDLQKKYKRVRRLI